MAAASRRVRTARRLPGSTAWQHHSIAPSRAAGEGVSLVPHSVYGLKRDNISYKPLDDPNLVSPIIMSMRVPDESKDVRAMQTLIYRLDTEANMPCRTCRPGRHERRSAGLTRRTSPGQHGLNTARPAIRRPLFRERRTDMTETIPEETWVETPQGRLFAKRWRCRAAAGSAASPVVLLHDSLGCVELWRDFPAQLARATQRDVIAYDRLGFGRSDRHPAQLDGTFVSDEADHAFRALREQLGIDAFIAFGHSVGGGMAVDCAARFPAHCRALVSVAAQTFVEDRTIAGIRDAARQFAAPGQLDRLARYHGDKAEWVLNAWVDTWLAPAFRDWSLADVLPDVRCPTLAIHGEQDEYGSVRHPDRIATLSGGPSAVEILKGCGHVPHREQPRAVLDAVAAFLRRHGL